VDQDKVWQASLKGVSSQQIKHGLNQIALNGSEWPPSAPGFRSMCLGTNGPWEHKTAAYRKFEPSKAISKGTQADINKSHDSEMEKMRKSLRNYA